MKHFIFFILFTINFTSCTIYRSPQRKEFESESPQFRVQNLKLVEVNQQSIRSNATSKRLVTVLQNSSTSDMNTLESEFLWEYIINNHSIFESDNLKGVYRIYENN